MTNSEDDFKSQQESTDFTITHTLIKGHAPEDKDVKFSIGPYKIVETIGKGGMGEVYLAFDTICGRKIALKRIRPDLLEYKQINNRFLKEAHVTSQLTHPSIIPIYAIHKKEKEIYYTMPYVKGETLKQILRKTHRQSRKGEKLDHIGGSIPALIRIFISICQAIAYAHSKNVLHRDLKPENIIIGEFGEVLILDWGLAKLVQEKEQSLEDVPEPKDMVHLSGITRIGKVVGTVNYMAPERATGNTASYQTDIYSLGVILYQLLTLNFPFRRESLEKFREEMNHEELPDPNEVAPYRDIPRLLSMITKKCLEPSPVDRYRQVDELIRDLENYIEGRAEWFQIASIDPHKKEDWEFQEHVYLQEHLAITRSSEVSDWMTLMVSKDSFSENIMLETKIKFNEGGHGLGFLLTVPEASERKHLNDGYCLWLGSDLNKSTKLMRSTAEVLYAPEVFLKRNEWYSLRIDKIDNIIHLYVNNKLQLSYISHIPLVGTHIGLISRDFDYEVQNLNVFVGGQNVMVKCLSVPDAFLAHKDYSTALSEYRRIGYSFPGRAEGREAMFRAGITLLEQAKNCSDPSLMPELYRQALKEFEKLYKTPGAPLEYLGKALVYQAMQEFDEEIKCFELGCRRYPRHPLLPILQEQIISRMHESSRTSRKATYQYVLMTICLLREVAFSRHVRRLFESLQKHWEPLPFIEENDSIPHNKNMSMHQFAVSLAFWLDKSFSLVEIIEKICKLKVPSPIVISNAIYALIKQGQCDIAKEQLKKVLLTEKPCFINSHRLQEDIPIILKAEEMLTEVSVLDYLHQVNTFDFSRERTILHLMERALRNEQTDIVFMIHNHISGLEIQLKEQRLFDAYVIWAHFLNKDWDKGAKILLDYPIEILSHETSPLYSIYGCWLRVSEGEDIAHIHFAGTLDTSYPRTWTLLGHYLAGRIHDNHPWFDRAFSWEKKELYRYLKLFYHCCGDEKSLEKITTLEKENYTE
ncbi:MAG: serine/threonine-protein kinase PknD [Chlamydiota bacterium]